MFIALKTSPAIHEQKKLLERAKTGDLLKAKIQQRPNRQELERRHILESHESHIDPSLADKYRMLEKAILVDQLNSKISHRPGPLELIEKNILHANEPIERIVKEGLVPFKASTDNLFLEDDSQSSEGDINQVDNSLMKNSTIVNEQQIQLNSNNVELIDTQQVTAPLNVINLNLPLHTSVMPKLTLQIPTVTLPCLVATTESLVPITAATTHQISTTDDLPSKIANEKVSSSEMINNNNNNSKETSNIKHHISSFLQNNQKFSSSGKEKIKKKCKIKPTSKIKAIKFHEYKGPPNAQKNSSSTVLSTASSTVASSVSPSTSCSSSSGNKKIGETNYELIMQQQCLLEYLEGIYKNPNNKSDSNGEDKQTTLNHHHEKVIEKFPDERNTEDVKKPFITIFPSKSPTSVSTTVDKDALITDTNKLGKMKVSELKSYLKKLNLPVSGPKPLLIERLKPYLPFKPSDILSNNHRNFDKIDNVFSPKESLSLKLSTNSIDSIDASQMSFKDEDVVIKEQQRQIEELQRKLLESQSELEQIRLSKASESSDVCLNNNNTISSNNNNNNNNSTSVLYDTNYQLPNKLPTVFVVGVTPISSSETSISTIPMLVQEHIEDSDSRNNNISNSNNSNVSNNGNNSTTNNHLINQNLVLSPPPTNPSEVDLSSDKDKSTTLYNNAIVQDDINDVLEILLKNEKWNSESDAFHTEKTTIGDTKLLLDSNVAFSPDNPMKFEKDILGGKQNFLSYSHRIQRVDILYLVL